MARKALFWLFMLTIIPGMIFGFLSVRIFHAKGLLTEKKDKTKKTGRSAGSLFLGYSTGWAVVIYAVLSYLMFA